MADSKVRRMWALPGAQLSAPMSLLMQGGDNTILDLPCPSFLIEHPKGLVLFDTGCNPKVIDDAVGYWGEMASHLPLQWKKSDTLDQQIKNVGYKPADVKYVILSHAHLDHAGGLTYFPKAKFIAGKNEIRYAYWPEPDKRWAFILNDYIPTRGYDWLELDQDFDLFGDGSLKFLLTPGHTPGECSLLVKPSQPQDSAHRRHGSRPCGGGPRGDDAARYRPDPVGAIDQAHQGDPRHA